MTEHRPTPVEEATVKVIADVIAGGAPVTEERAVAQEIWDQVVEPLRLGAISLGVDLAMRPRDPRCTCVRPYLVHVFRHPADVDPSCPVDAHREAVS